MPRETVRDEAGIYDTHVAWSADPAGHLQVGVESHDGKNLLAMLGVTVPNADMLDTVLGPLLRQRTGAHALTVREEIVNALHEAGMVIVKPHDAADFTGLWSTLDRDSSNRLIRNIRRARDAAFGKDE